MPTRNAESSEKDQLHRVKRWALPAVMRLVDVSKLSDIGKKKMKKLLVSDSHQDHSILLKQGPLQVPLSLLAG